METPSPSPPTNADDPLSRSSQLPIRCESTADSPFDDQSDDKIIPNSSEDCEFQEEISSSSANPNAEAIAATAFCGGASLSDELRDKIVRQVEYYFSDENLPNDKFMLKYVKKDKEGFVPIAVIATFRRMKKLAQDLSLIEVALRTSSQLVVSQDGRKVKRLHPLSISENKDTKICTVIVENLPENYSSDNLQGIFGNIGKIVNINIHDPHSTEPANARKTEFAISTKLHALIEYETVEAAENAVATLNDQKNWRSGVRVELLLKRMGKYGLIQKGHKDTSSQKNEDQSSQMASDRQILNADEHHDEHAVKEEEEHFTGAKGKRRSRYRGRGRCQLQQNASGQGHGHAPYGSSNVVSKPVPGPRMPDGTRGFTMGRGKSATSEPPNQQDV